MADYDGGRSAPSDLSPGPVQSSTTPTGFEVFFLESHQRLIRAAIAMGAENVHRADDLAQISMIAVLENWNRIYVSHFAYARAVVRNTIVKDREHAARERREGLVAWGGNGPGISDDPAITAREDEEWVRDVISHLPPMQQAVMRLTYEGFSPAEIAASLKTPATNVRSNLRLARNALKRHEEVGSRHRRVFPPSTRSRHPERSSDES